LEPDAWQAVRIIPAELKPAKGLLPVEAGNFLGADGQIKPFFHDVGGFHLGNPIVDVFNNLNDLRAAGRARGQEKLLLPSAYIAETEAAEAGETTGVGPKPPTVNPVLSQQPQLLHRPRQ
jgi:hypothetical protein